MVKVSQNDVNWLNLLLYKYNYTCQLEKDCVRCYSKDGIKSEKEWENIYQTIERNFSKRLSEVYHSTCTYHLDFKVYFRDEKYLRQEKINRILK